MVVVHKVADQTTASKELPALDDAGWRAKYRRKRDAPGKRNGSKNAGRETS